jgi:WD40 repeat protein
MTMPTTTSWIVRTSLIALGLFAIGAFAPAQPTKLPTADEVKALQAKYRTEYDKVVKDGIAKRFLPAIMEKAEELAKKSEAALAAGRLAQASEAIRQARWQLPYQPIGLPDNISRVIGNLRLRHSGEIKAVAFSPDGQYIATAGSDKLVKVWDLGNGHERFACVGHTDKVRGLGWSSDGKFIVSAGGEKNIKIWDAANGKEKLNIEAAGEEVTALALSKDGKHLFTGQLKVPGNPPNGLFVYETATGKPVRDVRDFPNKIDAIALSHDGTLLATGDANGNTRLWQYPSFIDNVNQPAFWTQQDLNGATYHLAFSPDDKTLARCSATTVKLYTTPQPGGAFQAAAPRATISGINYPARYACSVFSKDGKTLYVGTTQGNIQFFEADNVAQKAGEFKSAHNSQLNGLVFSPDGNRLASCSGDFLVRLWDFDVVLQSRDFEGHDAPVWTAAFSSDASRLISASADRTVKVWERDTGKAQFTITDHTAPVTCAQFSPDGKLIASGGGDKIIRIFDAANGKPLRTCEGHQGTITFLEFSFDSKRIVSGSADRRIKIWDADTGKEKLSIDDNPSIVASVAFSPNAKQIAVANVDQTIRLYDASSGKLQHSWNAHGVAVNGVAYSPDGQWLASCGADTAVIVWPLANPGADSIRLMGHAGPVSMVAFRKDNQHLVSCGSDQLVKLWKIEGNAGKEVQTFRGHKDWVTSVAFSKDGFHVVSSSVDRRLKIWEITSRELPLLAEHTAPVLAVAVSPDGKIIATGSEDKSIKLWDAKSGLEIATLTGHTSWVQALVFTPDSKRLISSGEESEIRFWNVSPPREIVRTPQQATLFGPKVINVRGGSSYIALDPAGKTIFVWIPPPPKDVGGAHRIDVIDFAGSAFLYDIKESGRIVKSVVVSPNGKIAATGGADGSVRLWDLNDKEAKPMPGGDWALFDKVAFGDIAISGDNTRLIGTSAAGEVKIATIADRKVLKTVKAHDGPVQVCMASPDGKYFATYGDDNVIKVWDMDGKELRRWDLGRNQGMAVINLAFTPDSKQLVTANANTTVYVLDLP